MNQKSIKKIVITLFSISMFFFLSFVGINLYVVNFAKPFIFSDISELPQKYTVIILGARVYKNNVSHIVRDRLEAGANCIKNKKAQKVLISGDHGRKNYDEVNRMKDFIQNVYRIDENIIFLDHAGFSTYDTMYRARDIFCVKDAIIVSQKFHLARSVYIAKKLGLDVVAIEAPEITPFSQKLHTSWKIRESLARVKAFFYVLFDVKPVCLGEKIPITEKAELSWD